MSIKVEIICSECKSNENKDAVIGFYCVFNGATIKRRSVTGRACLKCGNQNQSAFFAVTSGWSDAEMPRYEQYRLLADLSRRLAWARSKPPPS